MKAGVRNKYNEGLSNLKNLERGLVLVQSKRYKIFLSIIIAILLGALDIVILPGSLNAAAPDNKLTVFPAEGSRAGSETIQIQGGPFTASDLRVSRPSGLGSVDINIPIIRFGECNNLEEPDDDALLTKPAAKVTLPGGISAIYTPGNGKLEINITEAGLKYTATYDYTIGSPIFINTKDLAYNGTFCPREELIRISDDGNYLLVGTGYARWATIRGDNPTIIDLKTPSYHTVGAVPFVIQNAAPDFTEFAGTFTYTNPVSKPRISNILREGQSIASEIVNNSLIRPIRVNYKGGNTVTIVGSDFRENVKVIIGDLEVIGADALDTQIPGQISFIVPAAGEEETGKLFPLQVLNEDGGLALSAQLSPPVYLQYTRGDTNPTITKISPDKGFACGGRQVTIEGNNFRRQGEVYGFSGVPLVSFGGVKVPDNNVTIVDYKTIKLTVPANTAGPKNVAVENPDGELAVLDNGYTYISMPVITAVQATLSNVTSNISQVSMKGGQEIIIKGSGFMEGAAVLFAPEEPKVLDAKDSSTDFIYLPRDTSKDLVDCRFTYPAGVEGIDPVYIDSNTVKVQVPAGKLDSSGIMIINPDAGASEIFKGVTYALEELPAVKGVFAELLYNRVIKVHWESVPGAKYYEVYVQQGNGNLEILGTTSANSMVYENYRDRTYYRFLVRAWGDNAVSLPSRYSNQIYAYQSGEIDNDGPLNENSRTIRSGSQLLVTIGRADSYGNIMPILLNRSEFLGVKETIISIPAELIGSYRDKDIEIIGQDFHLYFNPRIFNASLSGSNWSQSDAGVRFTIKAVPFVASKKVTVLSNVYQLTASLYSGSKQTPIDFLAGNIRLELKFNPGRAVLPKTTTRPGYWDENEKQWLYASGFINSSFQEGSFTIRRMGSYAVIGERK